VCSSDLDAGAQFAVAPGLQEPVVQKARALGIPFIPGVMTPSEVERGLALGCTLLKFFPAETAGGVSMLKALSGPYQCAGAKFIPLGGVCETNAKAYLDMPIVAAVGGSWLCERSLVADENWSEITARTRRALALGQTR
jgi:2-dehydro-3-deoxyphosphogluconate aldolase / (4S)-4-hydroxy-2-oxoglutarate aldolase